MSVGESEGEGTRCSFVASVIMVSKKLMGVWAFLDVALLAGGAFALAMSLIWRAPDMLRHLVLSDSDLNGAWPTFARGTSN